MWYENHKIIISNAILVAKIKKRSGYYKIIMLFYLSFLNLNGHCNGSASFHLGENIVATLSLHLNNALKLDFCLILSY